MSTYSGGVEISLFPTLPRLLGGFGMGWGGVVWVFGGVNDVSSLISGFGSTVRSLDPGEH